MMDARRQRQIELALWPRGDSTPGTLWAILDGARDPGVYPALRMSQLDHQCLYAGDLSTELRAAAPHMVELNPRYGFTKTLFETAWGRSWGIFVRINDATRLRHHLRKLLTVQTEDRRKLLFRFYDPRVLRAYLPTCTPEEVEQVFGPVTAFFAEAPGGGGVMAFEHDGGKLSTRVTAFDLPEDALSPPG